MGGCQLKQIILLVRIVTIELECEANRLPWRRVDSVVYRLLYYCGPIPRLNLWVP